MLEKIKSYLSYASGLAILVLSALFFSQKRKTERVESELASAITKTEISLNDQATEAARTHADRLVEDYEKSKRD